MVRDYLEKRKNKMFYIKILLLTMAVIILFSVASIIIIQNGGFYWKYTFRNNISNCSFEYPLAYILPGVDLREATTIARINMHPFLLKSPKPGEDEAIGIAIFRKSDTARGYDYFIDFTLNNAQIGQNAGEFSLDERSAIMIDGAQGEKVTYHYYLHDMDIIRKFDPVPRIEFEAYFEKNGCLWNVSTSVLVRREEQTRKDFEHILKSFRFLD